MEQPATQQQVMDYKELFEFAVDGILLGSPEGIILSANSSMHKLSGRTSDQLIGKHVSILFSEEELTKLPLRFDLLKKGETVISQRKLLLPDGGFRSIEMHTKTMPSGNFQSIYHDISDRIRTEKALKESEEIFRKTFYISPDSVNINRLDDGMYVSINEGFTKIMGYTESEVIGKTSEELKIWVNPVDRKTLVKGLKKDGIVQNHEAQFCKKNGEIRFGQMSASLLELTGVKHIVSVTRDITAQKKIEEESKKSESKLRAIFSAMTDVILVVDSNGRYLEIAPSNPSLLYKPPIELLGKTTHEVFPKEQADFFMHHITTCLTSQQETRMEYSLEIAEKKLWFSAILSPLNENSVLLVARDITEKNLAEQALNISDKTYKGILNTINEAIYIQDEDGTFLDVNEGAVKMYGYSREELIGKNPLFVAAEGKNDLQKVVDLVKLAFEGTPQQFEFWGKRKNGEVFPKLVQVYKGIYFEKDVIIAVSQEITESKKANKALRESEERYRQLFENSPLGIYRTTPDGRILASNPALDRMLGYSSFEEYSSRNLEQKPDASYNRKEFKKRLERDNVITGLEAEWLKKDGTPLFVRENAMVVRDENGVVLYYDGTVEDITERKLSEQKLKESEELFRNLIENITDVFYISDENGRMKYCSPNFFKFTGFSPEDIMGHIYIRVVALVDRRKVVEHYTSETFNGVLDTNMELRIQRKDGTLFWAEQNTRIVRDEEGKVVEYRNVARDISERKKAEKELLKSEERYRLISNLSSDYIFSTKITQDGNAELDWVMGAFEKITGYTLEEYKSMGGWRKVVHPEDRQKDRQDFQKLLKNQKVVSEVRTIQKNGNIVWTRSYAQPIWDEKTDKLVGIYGAAQDITEQKLAEEQLRRSEIHFRSVWENSASGMRLTDKDGNIIAVNSAFCQMVGKSKEELEHFNLSVIYFKQDREAIQQKHDERFKTRTVHKLVEKEFSLWNGKKVWFRVVNSFIESESAEPLLLGIFTEITEQKLAEEQIKKLSQAVEQSAGSIIITDLAGNIEYVNKKFEEITGYSFEEVKGRNPRILKSGETPHEEYKKMWDTILAGNDWRGNLHNRKKDGSLYWENTTISAVKNQSGVITNFLAIKDDITEDKLKEEMLKKSELHFRSVWESSVDGMRLADEHGRIVLVNAAFEKLFRKKKASIIGKTIDCVYGIISGFSNVESYIRHFKARAIKPFMQRNITRWDESLLTIEMTNSFVEVEAHPTLLLTIFHDVTERVLNDRLLKESYEFNTSLLQNVPFGMDIVDQSGSILFQSESLIELTGTDSTGKKCWDVYTNEKKQCENCPLKSKIIVGKTTFIEIPNLIPGRTFEAYHTGIMFKGEMAMLETFVESTQRKEAEMQINAEKEKAVEANKVKTNFLENMSHELRTPMIPILGFTETISEMDELPDEVKEMAVMMNQGAKRLLETLNIILDLSQIEKERAIIKPTEFNLLKIVNEVFTLFKSMAEKKGLYLEKEFEVEQLYLFSDERMLRHIINNLVNNGLKFTKTGGITIKTKLEKSGHGIFAVIQVCDTGIGIPKDKQDIIWEEFRQGSEGIGRSFEGNGLGLTITKNFIEKLGGTISVESEQEKGSMFTVRIPIGKVSGIQDVEIVKKWESNKLVSKEAPSVSKPLRKLLYVEDEEISFSVVKHFLKNIVTLDWAKNGQDGVVLARGNRYEAILMDINLARGIDGMQTTKLIRELPQYRDTPIIAITAFAMRGDKEEFIGAGCSHYIAKPFTKAALQNLIAEVFGGN